MLYELELISRNGKPLNAPSYYESVQEIMTIVRSRAKKVNGKSKITMYSKDNYSYVDFGSLNSLYRFKKM